MIITSYSAQRGAPTCHRSESGDVLYEPSSHCRVQFEAVLTTEELREVNTVLAKRGDVSLIETPSETPVAGTMGETVFASGSTRATTAKTEPLSDWCPCGIWRADCTHHKIRHEGDPKP